MGIIQRVLVCWASGIVCILLLVASVAAGEVPAFFTVGKTYQLVPQGTIFRVVETETGGWIKADVNGVGGGLMWLNTSQMSVVKLIR